MGLINWIFDIYQHHRIDQVQKEAMEARMEVARVASPQGGVDTARLERALGELALAVKTVQRLAVEKGLCTHEELHQKLRQIDLEDGLADGRAPLP